MTPAAKCRWTVAIAAVLALSGGLAAQQPRSEEQRLAELARQLDADEFLSREHATESLLKAGPLAFPALRSVLKDGSLEATSRAFYILRELGLAAKFEENDEAWSLLNELAARKEVPTIARRAEATLAELTRRRSAQAQSELEALGAKIGRNDLNGLRADEPISFVEIGPEFRGQAQDLWRLKWLIEVPQVVFAGEKATDEWIKRAAAMPGLEELHVYGGRLTDAALAPLADHATLDQLGIYYTPLGDAALSVLEKLPKLSFVKLYGTQVTAKRAGELTAAAPGLAVDFRRGAFLGVGCSRLDGTCTISSVHLGSPAQKAGLAESDIIVRFGRSTITTFDTLTELIRQNAAGDEVEIEVSRRSIDENGNQQTRSVVAKVTFTAWEQKQAVEQPRPR